MSLVACVIGSPERVAVPQLLSVISLLSSEKPNLDSPANVDAAKEVRESFDGMSSFILA